MEEQGAHREIWTSASEGDTGPRRRRPAVVTGVSALVAVVVCGVGLTLAHRAGDTGPAGGAATVSPLPIPMIMSAEDLEGIDPDDLPGSVERATARLAEAVRAGEKVYGAAREAAPPPALKRLRGALDEATTALEGTVDRDASDQQLTARLEALDRLRTKILEAAAGITAVRTVPGAELPPGTTTALVASPESMGPGDDGTGTPGTAGDQSGTDSIQADGSGSAGSGSSGSGSSGSGSAGTDPGGTGGGGPSGGGGGTGDGDDTSGGGDGPDSVPEPTPSPTPAPSPSSPAPEPSPSPSGSA